MIWFGYLPSVYALGLLSPVWQWEEEAAIIEWVDAVIEGVGPEERVSPPLPPSRCSPSTWFFGCTVMRAEDPWQTLSLHLGWFSLQNHKPNKSLSIIYFPTSNVLLERQYAGAACQAALLP